MSHEHPCYGACSLYNQSISTFTKISKTKLGPVEGRDHLMLSGTLRNFREYKLEFHCPHHVLFPVGLTPNNYDNVYIYINYIYNYIYIINYIYFILIIYIIYNLYLYIFIYIYI